MLTGNQHIPEIKWNLAGFFLPKRVYDDYPKYHKPFRY